MHKIPGVDLPFSAEAVANGCYLAGAPTGVVTALLYSSVSVGEQIIRLASKHVPLPSHDGRSKSFDEALGVQAKSPHDWTKANNQDA